MYQLQCQFQLLFDMKECSFTFFISFDENNSDRFRLIEDTCITKRMQAQL